MKSPFRSDLLAGKIALISGGGSGINFGIAQAFAAHGAKVAIMGRRAEVLEQAAAELRKMGAEALPVQGDVRDPDLCAKLVTEVVRHWGRLDILVNGAAGNFLCMPERLSSNGFRTVVDIDLNGTFNLSRAAFDSLKASQGVILNISATLHYQGTPMQAHASAAKAGVDALTVSLGCDWGRFGIRVVGIAPGPIEGTEGIRRLGPQNAAAKIASEIPLGRLGQVEEIGHAALFLCSEAGSYITGETLVVDGGQWLYKPPMVPRELVEKMLDQRS
jgi:peroxisomal 2,4-dienoyl-CoA reductase